MPVPQPTTGGPRPVVRPPTEERILAAAYACIARFGMAKTTVDDVAKEAGLSRATVHRYFPGGREPLLACVIDWEVEHFFARLAAAVQGSSTLSEVCEEALAFAVASIEDHTVLQAVLRSEPQLLVPRITAATNRLQPFVTEFLLPYVYADASHGRTRAGIEPRVAADWTARLLLSYLNTHGAWDFTDRAEVRRATALVLAGVLAEEL